MTYLLGIGGVLALLAALIFGVGKWENKLRADGQHECVAEYDAKAVAAGNEQRAEEARRAAGQSKAQDAARKAVETARADAANARDALAGLQRTLAAGRDRPASSDPAVNAERATSATLGELFGVCTTRYTMLGQGADEARNAGQLCERLYDSNISPIKDAVNALKKGSP